MILPSMYVKANVLPIENSSNVACLINEDVWPAEVTMTDELVDVLYIQDSSSKRINQFCSIIPLAYVPKSGNGPVVILRSRKVGAVSVGFVFEWEMVIEDIFSRSIP